MNILNNNYLFIKNTIEKKINEENTNNTNTPMLLRQ